jgi:hypothetical protein
MVWPMLYISYLPGRATILFLHIFTPFYTTKHSQRIKCSCAVIIASAVEKLARQNEAQERNGASCAFVVD